MRTPNEPNIVVMYIIAGIAAIIIFTFLVIVIVICLLKKKTRFGSDISNDQLHPETLSKRGSLYNGFSIDEFDTEKINQLNYYNSLRQVKPSHEREGVVSDGDRKEMEANIQRNLEYCTPDLCDYRESDGTSSSSPDPQCHGASSSSASSASPPSVRLADPTYARPVPKAQRSKVPFPPSPHSPLTISERTTSSPANSSDAGGHTYEFIADLASRDSSTHGSSEPIYRSILKKVPPPTLPKTQQRPLDVTVTPRPPDLVTVLDLVPPSPPSSLPDELELSPTDKRVRNCTQV